MERIKSLPLGTKLMLGSGILLFFDLFFTWQNVPEKFGRSFEVTTSLDGWDRFGLVIGLLTVALLILVAILETEVELSGSIPWNLVVMVLGFTILGVTLVKVLTDDDSAIASYVGVALAGVVAVGAFLNRGHRQPEPAEPTIGNWRPRVRPSASPSSPQPRTDHPDPHAADPQRW